MRAFQLIQFQLLAIGIVAFVELASLPSLYAQAGLRESLERLDRNQDGRLQPSEITPLARPYLERITKERRIRLDESVDIDDLREAARIYYALQNGVAGNRVRPETRSTVKGFGPDQDQPYVPEFGLADVKYPYTEEDLDEARSTLRRYDRNNDGFIDRRESNEVRWTHRNPFDDDINRDDRLSRLELVQRYARRRLLSEDAQELVQKARRTGGEIRGRKTTREDPSDWWKRGGSDFWLTASLMGRFDANRNGRLEASEAENLRMPLARIDLDRDGELTREELFALVSQMQNAAGDVTDGLPGWFFELDADRDGQVAMSEFSTEWTREKQAEFRSLDLNSDGFLTAREVIRSTAAVGGNFVNDHAQVVPPRQTIISEIEIDEDILIRDVDVEISITHTSVGMLDGFLTGPDGQRIELFTEIGGSGDHFDQTIFDDQSSALIVKAKAPFTGRFLPEGRLTGQPGLSAFNGTSAKGVWQLVIRGTRSERFGMLHSWGLTVKPMDEVPAGGHLDDSDPEPESENVPSAVAVSDTERERFSGAASFRRSESSGGFDEELKKPGTDSGSIKEKSIQKSVEDRKRSKDWTPEEKTKSLEKVSKRSRDARRVDAEPQ
jgi:subtilisin-like proprotein convertase family protein/Ca2+-binding EF-hand superfamily protein